MSTDLVLAKIDRAKAFLMEATSLQQVKEVIALADAAGVFAKRINASILTINHAAEGGFLLRLSGADPTVSEWIEWNRKRIDYDRLISLLRFDVDPVNFSKMDWRPNHHPEDKTIPLQLA